METPTNKKKVSDLTIEEKIIQGLESFADSLERGEDLSKKFTCRKVILNLEAISYTPAMVKSVRARLGVSQALFAQFLGVSKSWLQAWERGAREPSPMACRFMDEIMINPEAARGRLLKLAMPAREN